MTQPAAIIERDVERDRKTCVALDLKVNGANRELAQWLIDHPHYSNAVIGRWIGCSESRIFQLRKWARGNFVGAPFGKYNHPDKRRGNLGRDDAVLETLDNSTNDDDMADPAIIEDNALHALARMNEHARIFKKFFKLSTFDREAEFRISAAIDRMIQKWRSTKSALTKRKHDNGESEKNL